jgi:hypothetical protein
MFGLGLRAGNLIQTVRTGVNQFLRIITSDAAMNDAIKHDRWAE